MFVSSSYSIVLRAQSLQNVHITRCQFSLLLNRKWQCLKARNWLLYRLLHSDAIGLFSSFGHTYQKNNLRFTTSDSRSSAKIQKVSNMFRLSDYDCVGFDLDNTLLRYKVKNMVSLEYEVLSKFLVDEKGYSAKYLLKPLEESIDILQKGLFIDFCNGNLLQVGIDGYVLRASHGTKFMTTNEIKEYYGPDRKWTVTEEFSRDMMKAWNGPISEKVRTCLDYFDMPSALAFARIIDSLDEKIGHKQDVYNVWPDVLAGLMYMFNRDHFSLNKAGYFPSLKSNPDHYIKKCSPTVLAWLQKIKETKTSFLVTGSNVDFASFTAQHTFGDDWRDLFDLVVCYARKPGFFTGERPFLKLEGFQETDVVKGSELEPGNIYSQGNWKDLHQFLVKQTNQEHPKCVYIGDNLVQDIYTPAKFVECDTVAVVEEMSAEGMVDFDETHSDANILKSNCWGSYFFCKDDENRGNSFWDDTIRKYSKICVPHVEILASQPLNFKINCFNGEDAALGAHDTQVGYFPSLPKSLEQEM